MNHDERHRIMAAIESTLTSTDADIQSLQHDLAQAVAPDDALGRSLRAMEGPNGPMASSPR